MRGKGGERKEEEKEGEWRNRRKDGRRIREGKNRRRKEGRKHMFLTILKHLAHNEVISVENIVNNKNDATVVE